MKDHTCPKKDCNEIFCQYPEHKVVGDLVILNETMEKQDKNKLTNITEEELKCLEVEQGFNIVKINKK